jgi:ribosome-binding protein aMBF1 (putative translation factor)
VIAGLAAAGCAAPESEVATPAQQASASVAQQQPEPERAAAQAKLAAEARALVAQAETDVQRARAKRALWLKAWEDLLAARQAVAGTDYAQAITRAREASELAELGLEQLAYPAVK